MNKDCEQAERHEKSEELQRLIAQSSPSASKVNLVLDYWYAIFNKTLQSKHHGTYNTVPIEDLDGAIPVLMYWITLLGENLLDVFGSTNDKGIYSTNFSTRFFKKCIPHIIPKEKEEAWKVNMSTRLAVHLWARISFDHNKKSQNGGFLGVLPKKEMDALADDTENTRSKLEENIKDFAEKLVKRKEKTLEERKTKKERPKDIDKKEDEYVPVSIEEPVEAGEEIANNIVEDFLVTPNYDNPAMDFLKSIKKVK